MLMNGSTATVCTLRRSDFEPAMFGINSLRPSCNSPPGDGGVAYPVTPCWQSRRFSGEHRTTMPQPSVLVHVDGSAPELHGQITQIMIRLTPKRSGFAPR